MDPFLHDLMSRPPLDADAERALARRARDGDRGARSDLITAGMRAVVLRARMRGLAGEDLRDAVQSGAIGLIRAVDRYDPDRGARLATYAWHFIGSAMTTPARTETALDDLDVAAPPDPSSGADLLDGLPSQAVEVLRLRHGIGRAADLPMPRRAVAERLGLTEAEVRTIEGRAMRHLHRRLARVGDRAPRQRGDGPP